MIITAVVIMLTLCGTALPIIAQESPPLATQEALLGPTADAIRTEIAATAAAIPLSEVAFDQTILLGFLCAVGSMLFLIGLIAFGFWLSAHAKRTS
ncbi:MAG: hypothetical protein KC708_19885 [Anaerolineae bacterium]|nr:hypothetical protein [Anaerolineae bacterium]